MDELADKKDEETAQKETTNYEPCGKISTSRQKLAYFLIELVGQNARAAMSAGLENL